MKEDMDKVLRHFRWADVLPTSLARSRAHAESKGNGKKGIPGDRVYHMFDASGMAWHNGALVRSRRQRKEGLPFWAQGGLRKRRREYLIISICSAMWRCRKIKLPFTVQNFDARNAFGSIEKDPIKADA